MTQGRIAFIGAGNMARSLIGGLINSGFAASSIWASTPAFDGSSEFAELYPINWTADNLKAAENADILVLAVKPQTMPEVATQLREIVNSKQHLVISIAAGVRQAALQAWLGDSVAIVRCMPNTPSLVGTGATGMYANANVIPSQKNIAESIMRAVGIALWVVSEEQLDIVTALSASGPAYFFLIFEALSDAAVQLGLNSEDANLLTLQTALGAAHMALQSDLDLPNLRAKVTSPGGITQKAIETLEKANIREIMAQALRAAEQRAQELAFQYAQKNEDNSND